MLARWPVTPGGHPVGLAIDPPTHRLFIGCRNPQKMVVMSTEDGKVLAALPIGAGVDATGFDQGQAFASCRDGQLFVAGDVNGTFAIQQVVKMPAFARTLGIDMGTHRIYLPTAELEALSAGTTARPTPKPGSFMVVEVTRDGK